MVKVPRYYHVVKSPGGEGGPGGYRLAHGLAMQLCFNSVQFWVCKNGFNFFTLKTVHPFSPAVCFLCFFISQTWKMGKMPIKVLKEAKFPGFLFFLPPPPPHTHTKLTFKNHVQYLISSCQKALQVVGHTDWGSSHFILLCLYHLLVHSKLIMDALPVDWLILWF